MKSVADLNGRQEPPFEAEKGDDGAIEKAQKLAQAGGDHQPEHPVSDALAKDRRRSKLGVGVKRVRVPTQLCKLHDVRLRNRSTPGGERLA